VALDARASLALAPALASPAALWRAVAHASLASTASSLPAGLAALGRRLAEDAGAQPLFAAYALGFMLPASLVQVAAMNSWINMSWPFFPGVHTLRLHWALRPTQWVARALRATMQFRLVQAFGVFPPFTAPPQRWAIVFEGAAAADAGAGGAEPAEDSPAWRRYELRFQLSGPRTPPRFVAPWHPRLDHAIFYEPVGSGGLLAGLYHHSPYGSHSSASIYQRLQLRLLEGGAEALAAAGAFFRVNPFPDAARPPRFVRLVACQYTPASAAHRAATGELWIERRCGLHAPTMSLAALNSLQLPTAPAPALAALASPASPGAAVPSATSPAQLAEHGAGALWPFSDALPAGPEDFAPDAVFYRERAGRCAGEVSEADYDEAWTFIAALRRAVVIEHTTLGQADEVARRSPPGKAPPSSTSAVAAAAAAAAAVAPGGVWRRGSEAGLGRGRTAGAVPPGAALGEGGEHEAEGEGEVASPPVVDLISSIWTRRPTPAAVSAAVAEKLYKAISTAGAGAGAGAGGAHHHHPRASGGPAASVPLVEQEAASFVWPVLPAVAAQLRRRGWRGAKLARVRITIARLCAPLLRAATRVFHREPPTAAELAAELAASGGGAASSYEGVGDMIAGEAPDSTALRPGEEGLDAGGPHPVFVYRGNDDAALAGAMRNPLRWLMHAHRLMLVGGRAAFEAVAADLLQAPAPACLLGVRHSTAAFCADGPDDAVGCAPLPLLWARLAAEGERAAPLGLAAALAPARMATEAGSFLYGVLEFDELSKLATCFHRLQASGRAPLRSAPRPTAPGSRPPRFMPPALDWVGRALATPQLRCAVSPAGEPQRVPARAPRWRNVDSGAWWELDEAQPLTLEGDREGGDEGAGAGSGSGAGRAGASADAGADAGVGAGTGEGAGAGAGNEAGADAEAAAEGLGHGAGHGHGASHGHGAGHGGGAGHGADTGHEADASAGASEEAAGEDPGAGAGAGAGTGEVAGGGAE
jgi:hypothetical protein